MTQTKFTKNELRNQQSKLNQLKRYLPTLQLKKAILQSEVNGAEYEIDRLRQLYRQVREKNYSYSALLFDRESVHLLQGLEIVEVRKRYENVAGVDLPLFIGLSFRLADYSLFHTPLWIDRALVMLRELIEMKMHIEVLEEKRNVLQRELREVFVRVNLFEKILIPRAESMIKDIAIFLGDQERSYVSQIKVAKAKKIRNQMGEGS